MQNSDYKVEHIPNKRKTWVDSVRGICMLAIVLNHTDAYLTGKASIIEFGLFGTNAVMTFFVISGYLFYSESNKIINIKRKLISIIRLLLIPYFIFSFLIAIPKALIHGYTISITDILISIICGQASWFIIALVVSKSIFVLLIFLSQKYSKFILPISSIVLTLIPFCISFYFMRIWNLNIGLMTIIYLYIGYVYHSKEKLLEKYITLKLCLPMLILVIILKMIETKYNLNMNVHPDTITSFPIFFIDTFIAAFIIISLMKKFSNFKILNFIGRNSIVYYFLCGGVPLLMGMLFRYIGLSYNGNYLIVLLDFLLVVSIMTTLTIIIINYFPFLIGRKKSEIKKING